MSLRTSSAIVLLAFCLSCDGGPFRQPVCEQRLPSGKVIKVTSCLLVWGSEHEERHPDQDSFALEYVSSVPVSQRQDRDRDAIEAFELIRPMSEQWHFSSATVAAFLASERTGPYDMYHFTRSVSGAWSFTRTSAKVFNTASGYR